MIEYSAIFERIIKQYTDDELQQICKTLNRIYNIYDSEGYRWTQLQYVLTKTSEADISALRRSQLSNQVINDLILRFYPCERVVKYYVHDLVLLCRFHLERPGHGQSQGFRGPEILPSTYQDTHRQFVNQKKKLRGSVI